MTILYPVDKVFFSQIKWNVHENNVTVGKWWRDCQWRASVQGETGARQWYAVRSRLRKESRTCPVKLEWQRDVFFWKYVYFGILSLWMCANCNLTQRWHAFALTSQCKCRQIRLYFASRLSSASHHLDQGVSRVTYELVTKLNVEEFFVFKKLKVVPLTFYIVLKAKIPGHSKVEVNILPFWVNPVQFWNLNN